MCKKEYENFLTNQLYAHFPGIEIFPATEYISTEDALYVSSLKLDTYPLHPVKIYTEFKEKSEKDAIDPFSALTSALLKGDKKLEAIQVHFTPLHDEEWKDDLSQKVLVSRVPKFLKKKYFRSSHWLVRPWKRTWFKILLNVFGKKEDET